jgi:hypothetical protein
VVDLRARARARIGRGGWRGREDAVLREGRRVAVRAWKLTCVSQCTFGGSCGYSGGIVKENT